MSRIRTHYDNLKVSRNAPPEVIRAAYKALTQKYHPDKNLNNAGAARVMHIINSSYEVLSDPQRRAAHDVWIADMEREAEEKRERRRRNNSLSIALENPADLDGRLAAEQKERMRLERLLTMERQRSAELYSAQAMPEPSGVNTSRRLMKITLGLCAPILVVGILLILAYKAGKVDAGFRRLSRGLPRIVASLSCPQPAASAISANNAKDAAALASKQAIYTRPKDAPNGLPWPRQAEYLSGSIIQRENGLSHATIDNTRNGSDVLAKLVAVRGVDGKSPVPTDSGAFPRWQSPADMRIFFIPAYGSFMLKKIDPGTYELRYQDLGQGIEWKSDAFTVLETDPSADSVPPGVAAYSKINVMLYRGPAESCKASPLRGGSTGRESAFVGTARQRSEGGPLWYLSNRTVQEQVKAK